MDNVGGINVGGQKLNQPIPFDAGGASDTGVSHAPLSLGAAKAAPAPQVSVPKPAVKPSEPPPAAGKPAPKLTPTDRIQGVRKFFTKLHPGALNFMDEQITRWLKENPDVRIKRTNVAVGEVQDKKTEPNILITVWY